MKRRAICLTALIVATALLAASPMVLFGTAVTASEKETVVVAGASGGTGRYVMKILKEEGYRVEIHNGGMDEEELAEKIKTFSHTPEKYGTGHVEGLVAGEIRCTGTVYRRANRGHGRPRWS